MAPGLCRTELPAGLKFYKFTKKKRKINANKCIIVNTALNVLSYNENIFLICVTQCTVALLSKWNWNKIGHLLVRV